MFIPGSNLRSFQAFLEFGGLMTLERKSDLALQFFKKILNGKLDTQLLRILSFSNYSADSPLNLIGIFNQAVHAHNKPIYSNAKINLIFNACIKDFGSTISLLPKEIVNIILVFYSKIGFTSYSEIIQEGSALACALKNVSRIAIFNNLRVTGDAEYGVVKWQNEITKYCEQLEGKPAS